MHCKWLMGYLAHGPPFFAWVVDETKLEIENLENQTPNTTVLRLWRGGFTLKMLGWG